MDLLPMKMTERNNMAAMDITKAGYYNFEETTADQPFPEGTCGSKQFRIPGIITLQNGHLFAVADARWDDADSDYGGIDTVFSVSEDGGKTWRNGFAAMFPDSDGTPDNPLNVTTCIDPCVVQDKNGLIHVFVNMNPSGITTGLGWPGKGSGFIEIDGVRRLSLTPDFADADTVPAELRDDKKYYLGDFADGFASVFCINGDMTAFSVDRYFNLYENSVPLYQKQVNSEKTIQQNVFYKDSALHVFNTMFTLHLTTVDEGRTWDAELVNHIKLESENALISSPGNGTLASDGTLLMPFYVFFSDYSAVSLFIYSKDNGLTWQRTPYLESSGDVTIIGECKIVDLGEVRRLFVRNLVGHLCYADYVVSDGRWEKPVRLDIRIHSDCNFSAIKHNDLILVSCPAGIGHECKERRNGRLFTFSIDRQNKLKLDSDIQITDGAFSYSCLTADSSSVKVLYDTCGDGLIILKNL